MDKAEQIAWKWLINQPVLGEFASIIKPFDFNFQIKSSKVSSMLIQVPPLAEVIRQRSILYSKAGCKKDACVKSAVRDYLEAIQ